MEYHVRRDETGNVQVWLAIKVELIVDKLVGRIRRYTLLGNDILGNLLRSAVTSHVRGRNVAMNMAETGVSKMATKFDDFIGINVLVLASSCNGIPCEEPFCNTCPKRPDC